MASPALSDDLPPRKCPKTGHPLPYVGGPIPSWFREGTRVRVKSTPETRIRGGSGLRTSAGSTDADCVAWAGEIPVVRRRTPDGGDGRMVVPSPDLRPGPPPLPAGI